LPSSATRNLKVSANIDFNTALVFKVSEKIWQHGFTEQPLAFVPHAKWPHGFACARDGLASFASAPFAAAIRFRQRKRFRSFRRLQTGETVKNFGRTSNEKQNTAARLRPAKSSAIAASPASFPSLRRLR
jgi:hypothetical protein